MFGATDPSALEGIGKSEQQPTQGGEDGHEQHGEEIVVSPHEGVNGMRRFIYMVGVGRLGQVEGVVHVATDRAQPRIWLSGDAHGALVIRLEECKEEEERLGQPNRAVHVHDASELETGINRLLAKSGYSNNMSLFLAVDCGGSKTAAVISDASGAIVGRGTAGPSNITYLSPDAFIRAVADAVTAALRAALATTAAPPLTLPMPTLLTPPLLPPAGPSPFAAAWFGISGADSPTAIARIAPGLALLLALPPGPRLAIANDTHLLAAPLRMHSDVAHAVALIAGTGSIAVAFSRAPDGAPIERARAGGWGWILGDEGGGFALGRGALRAMLRAHDEGGPALASGALVAGVLAHFDAPGVMEVLTGVYASDPPAQSLGPGAGSASLSREKRISTLSPLVFAAAFGARDPLALGVVEEAACELGAQVAGMLASTGGALPTAQSVLCFGGSLVGVEEYRALVVADLERRGHVFARIVFVDDPAALGATGLAAAFGRAGEV